MLPCGKPIIIGGGYYSGPMPLQCEIFDPVSETWTYTDPMSTGRSHFTSVILHTGKVLAIAGYCTPSADRTNKCEIYDPSEPEWTTKPSLNYARAAHTVTLLPIIHTTNCSTNVLVTGGENTSGYLKSCELYNYSDEVVTVTGNLNHARSHHTANLLPSGKVLVAGGRNAGGELRSCELFDVPSETWAFTDSLINPRFDHTATLLKDGRILVTGGQSSAGYMLSSEVYDGSSWTTTGNLNIPRARHTATLLLDGRVLVAGGENAGGVIDTCEIWDPGTGNWTPTATLIPPRCLHTAVLLQSGKVMVIGGKNSSGNAITNCEVYNPSTGNWTSEASLNQARYLHNSTLTYSGLVLVTGGTDGINYLSSCEIFDPAIRYSGGLSEWKVTSSLNTPRATHASCVIPDEKPYVLSIGGDSSFGVYLSSVEEYDVGLGYMSDWQSEITNYQSVTHIADSMYIEGELFRGVTEADGGNHCHIASSDHPIISLLRIGGGNFQNNGGGEMLLMPWSSDWNYEHTHVHLPADAPQGYYALWSIVNGIPCKWYKACIPVEEAVAEGFSLRKAEIFPNPSTGTINIRFSAKSTGDAVLKIYDCSGRLVKNQKLEVSPETSSGQRVEAVRLDGLKSGIYFYSIILGNSISKGKFTLL